MYVLCCRAQNNSLTLDIFQPFHCNVHSTLYLDRTSCLMYYSRHLSSQSSNLILSPDIVPRWCHMDQSDCSIRRGPFIFLCTSNIAALDQSIFHYSKCFPWNHPKNTHIHDRLIVLADKGSQAKTSQ